jgi:hypothetical protein
MDSRIATMKKKGMKIILPLAFALAFFLLIRVWADGEDGTFFPHSVHVDTSACKDCHAGSGTPAEPVFPDARVCVECHGDERGDKLNPDTRKKQNAFLVFSHKTHGKSDCLICHTIRENNRPSIPSFRECSACHSEMAIRTGCTDCHPAAVKPSYHRGLWVKTHGFRSESPTDRAVHGRDCGLCHSGPACVKCHQTRKPESHTGFFRIRGHGLTASIESGSCRTCHMESFCVRCHRETKPLNHRGNWEYTHGGAIPGGLGGDMGKCAVCHKPSWCASCHNKK